MITSAVAAIALSVLANDAKPKITAVSMFKNGYSLIARRTDIPGSGEYIVDEPPMASYGTFWHLPTDGISITSTASTMIEEKKDSPAANLDQVLSLNVGEQVTVDFNDAPSMTGTLMSTVGNYLVLQTSEGVVFIGRDHIKRILFPKVPKVSTTEKNSRRVMKLTVEANKPGAIDTIGLEHGLTWVPAYAIDISNDKELNFVAKGTVINELADLDGVDASFITGFPNVRYLNVIDPLTSPNSLDQILQMAVSGGFTPSANMASQMAAGRAAYTNAPPTNDFTAGYTPQGTGEQREDLFFYKLHDITLKKGDRAAFTLFSYKAPYDHVFTWNVNGSYLGAGTVADQDVWHSIVFKNASGKPLTTALASVFHDNDIVGQDLVNYCPPGAELNVQLSKAMDIQATSSVEEIARVRSAISRPEMNAIFDFVTVRGTLTIRNLRKEKAKMRIFANVEGEVTAADGDPEIHKTGANSNTLNPTSNLAWSPEVRAGETLKLTYTYKEYFRMT